jgi:hypothetical protein
LSSVSLEPGNKTFILENRFLIDVLHHVLIRNFSTSSKSEIVNRIEILGLFSFSDCTSLSSFTFESTACLTRIEVQTFSNSPLQSILLAGSVEILGSKCFSSCESLSSITSESISRLIRIESEAFSNSSLRSIVIPSTILFVAPDDVFIGLEMSILDGNSRLEFDRGLEPRRSGQIQVFVN